MLEQQLRGQEVRNPLAETRFQNADTLRNLLDGSPGAQTKDAIVERVKKQQSADESVLAVLASCGDLPRELLTQDNILEMTQSEYFTPDIRGLKEMGEAFTKALKTVDEDDLPGAISSSMAALPSVSSNDLKQILQGVTLDVLFMQEAFKEASLTDRQGNVVMEKYLADKQEVANSGKKSPDDEDVMETIPKPMFRFLPVDYISHLNSTLVTKWAQTLLTGSDMYESYKTRFLQLRPGKILKRRPRAVNIISKFNTSQLASVESETMVQLINTGAMDPYTMHEIPTQTLKPLFNQLHGQPGRGMGAELYTMCAGNDLSLEEAQQSCGNFIQSASSDGIKSLCSDERMSLSDLSHLVKILCLSEPFTGDQTFKEIVSCTKQKIDSLTDDVPNIDISVNFACILPELTVSQLTKLGSQQELCEAVESHSLTRSLRSNVHALLDFCLSPPGDANINKLCCQSDDGIGGPCTVIEAGDFTVGDDSSALSCAKAGEFSECLAQRMTNCSARKALYNCLKDNYPLTSKNNIRKYGTLLDQLSEAELEELPKSELCGVLESLDIGWWRLDQYNNLRSLFHGFKGGSQCSTDVLPREKIVSVLMAAERRYCQSSSKRKRRSTSGLTCKEIRLLENSALSALDASELETLSDEEFTSCLDVLGVVEGLTQEQYAALAGRAKKVYGDVSAWSSSQLIELGGIVSGLTTSDLALLEFSNADAIISMGSTGLWTSDKLSVVFKEFLKNAKENNASLIDRADLSNLGQLVCGAHSQHIEEIMSEEYCHAAEDIGLEEACEASQLQSWAQHAKACFGDDVTKWTPGTVETVGGVIGGLSKAEIMTLSREQIENIRPWTIPKIPHTEFAGFTEEQFAFFSPQQIAAITTEQLGSLSDDVKDVISNLAESIKSDLGDVFSSLFGNRASAMPMSLNLIVLLLVGNQLVFLL
ncbi:hypothetical protein CAPTEDRAFT_212377 [Capitella teleta]|uniref:Otoancorin n=1 Tax=Capitella teleta TaxID=283909 RepID=R7UQA6_CAPTE|nr:hypothetical protein CAPTEDRAFT_212377 [Capitella teleta]|eukprot:ELU08714.1 hypothetical protein CAPTEDRAFT_212377 [Capitella teleta]